VDTSLDLLLAPYIFKLNTNRTQRKGPSTAWAVDRRPLGPSTVDRLGRRPSTAWAVDRRQSTVDRRPLGACVPIFAIENA